MITDVAVEVQAFGWSSQQSVKQGRGQVGVIVDTAISEMDAQH